MSDVTTALITALGMLDTTAGPPALDTSAGKLALVAALAMAGAVAVVAAAILVWLRMDGRRR